MKAEGESAAAAEVVVHWSRPGYGLDAQGRWRYWLLACTGGYARGPGEVRDYRTSPARSRVNCPACLAAAA